jgi:hypothetical protein
LLSVAAAAIENNKRKRNESVSASTIVSTMSLSKITSTAAAALQRQFEIDEIVDVEEFPFELPRDDAQFGTDTEVTWPHGEDTTATHEFHTRLQEALGSNAQYSLHDVHGRLLFQRFHLEINHQRAVNISGKTDLVVLPAGYDGGNLSSAEIKGMIRVAIELKCDANVTAKGRQIVGELIFAAFESQIPTVYGVLTSGNYWEYLWFRHDRGRLIIERFTTRGWINGVRHLCALLLVPYDGVERLVPAFRQTNTPARNEDEEGDYSDEGQEESEQDKGGAASGNAEDEDIDDDLNDMPDWFDEDGSASLHDDQVAQRFLFATRNLPMFADIQVDTLNKSSLHKLQSSH